MKISFFAKKVTQRVIICYFFNIYLYFWLENSMELN